MARRGALGIVAGGGDLPAAIAEAAHASGRDLFVIALDGLATGDFTAFPNGAAGLGELGKIFKLLKGAGVSEVTLAGRVARPNMASLKFDARAALALPKILAAARQGDDAILRAIVGLMEKEGFKVVGTAEAAPDLLATAGVLGKHKPSERDRTDIARAAAVVKSMGALDIGQAAAVCEGLVLAVEAAEGTDEMVRRVSRLPAPLRGTPAQRRGVLLKATKPKQERRVDLPVVGPQTIALAAEAGLSGIAIEAGATIVMQRAATIAAADAAKLFLYGFGPQDVE